MPKYVFKKPFKFEETEFSEIDLDLEGLTGRDLSVVKRHWAGKGNFSAVIATDTDYCVLIACHAAKQPFEFADALPARDYTQIAQMVQNFLLGVDSESVTTQ